MTVPDRDSLGTYGGPWNDYQPVADPTTDVPATGGNQWAADTAGMTKTAVRAWGRFSTSGTSVPTLLTSFTMWPTGTNDAPVVARTTTGLYTMTLPVTVEDELGNDHTLNLMAGDCQCESQSVLWTAQVSVSGNVASVAIFNSSAALADPPLGNYFFLKVY
jgi:hypothetical protein